MLQTVSHTQNMLIHAHTSVLRLLSVLDLSPVFDYQLYLHNILLSWWA